MADALLPPRVLSGIQPSGTIHLGNYFGAIRQQVALQDEFPNACLYFIADYHALTTLRDPEALRRNVFDLAVTYLACGLDPSRALLFRQSDIPEVCELTWLLSTVTDGDGLVTTVLRDENGALQGILSPYGQQSTVTLTGDGYLSTLQNPAGETTAFTYGTGGLMTGMTDAAGLTQTYAYDERGLLLSDTAADGAQKTLARTSLVDGIRVTATSPLGRVTTYDVKTGEAALSGTAAVLAGVGTLVTRNGEHQVGNGAIGPVTQQLRRELVAIQTGEAPDKRGWLERV